MNERECEHFGDRLTLAVRRVGHPLCVGLDPYLDRIPPLFCDGPMTPGDERTAPAVQSFLLAVLDRLVDRVAVVKPQSAFFEVMGWRGMQVLDTITRAARERGLLVLMDAKHGDIGSTATAYAEAYLAAGSPFKSDALTLNPFLGRDSLFPFVATAKAEGAGLFILVKTSNPHSGDYQDLRVRERTLAERIAQSLGAIARDMVGPETGWSSLGLVVGATYPHEADRIREILPQALFLIPGYGAQGAAAADAVHAFRSSPNGGMNGNREGGIVNSSRAILFPDACHTEDAGQWERGFDATLQSAVTDLAKALAPPKPTSPKPAPPDPAPA